MSETQGSRHNLSTSSEVVDANIQDLGSAESFTILIHGVGDETSKDLLKGATKGYLASGFGNTVVQTTLSECPALSQERGAESILIKGNKGDHFVIALPWNNRVRLASLARYCLTGLLLLITMTAAAYALDNSLSGNWGPRIGLLLDGLLIQAALKTFGWKWGIFLIVIFSFAQWAFTWWAPWLWVFPCSFVVVLWAIASNMFIRCMPVARTTGWRLILATLVLGVAFISLASVHKIWFVIKVIPTNNLERSELVDLPVIGEALGKYYAARAATDINSSVTLPPWATQDDPLSYGPDPKNKIDPKSDFGANSPLAKRNIPEEASADSIDTKQIPSHIRNMKNPDKPTVHSGFVTCLLFILICIVGIVFIGIFGWVLDFGLDILHYGADEAYNSMMFGRLNDAIRWLHSQSPNAHLTIVAHSLGSVIASRAMSLMSDSPLLSQVTLITLGSPLNYLYQVFPNVANSPRELSAAICSKARWINLWRRSDEIGRELDVEPGALVQYCVGEGHHPNYWADGAVWRAVVYESLKIGDFRGEVSPLGDPVRCYLEVHLGRITALAILSLLFLGIVTWY